MHRRRGIAALAVAFCTLLLIIFGSGVARAEGEGNSLTVGVAEQEFVDDITSAGETVVADVYLIATAEPDDMYDTYHYTMIDPFTDLQAALDEAQAGTGDWTALYNQAAEVAKNVTPTVEGHPITGTTSSIGLDNNGLYLVLAHGSKEPTGSNIAYGRLYRYEFQASMVAMPTKYDMNGTMVGLIRTDDSYHEWHNTAEIFLKASRTGEYGSLIINKTVEDFSGEPSTFVFHIVEVNGGTYEAYASITYPEQESTIVKHIPAGIEVVVSEVYMGARYQLVSGNDLHATIVSDYMADQSEDDDVQTATVGFTNAPDGDHTSGGHGIENKFTYQSDEQSGAYGDWTHSATPADKLRSNEAE